ncbi:proprotein convertase P-domain-containing protein [bacterium]|nr:proprotein convertase P-domain-containing protein [bacterium]
MFTSRAPWAILLIASLISLSAFGKQGKAPQKSCGVSVPAQSLRSPHRALDEVYSSTHTPLPIPDGPGGTLVDSIQIPAGIAIEDINVGVSIEHTWIRDLRITLEHDSAFIDTVYVSRDTSWITDSTWDWDTTWAYIDTVRAATVLLVDLFPGDSIVNMTDCWFDDEAGLGIYDGQPPFTGGYVPLQSLNNIFANHTTTGDWWRLRVVDRFLFDTGTLLSWGIEINGAYSIQGTVTNSQSGAAISNANVEILDLGISALTNGEGVYRFSRLASGIYDLRFTKSNYDTLLIEDVNVVEGQTTTRDAQLVARVDFRNISYRGDTLDIPDQSSIQITMSVGDDQPVLDVDMTINITHSWVGDLIIALNSPGGTNATLFNPPANTEGENLVNCRFDDEATTAIGNASAPYTGSFRPESVLSVFDSSMSGGDWVITVEDAAAQDVGTFNGAILHFELERVQDGDESPVNVSQWTLHPAFPNPFNSSAQLILDVPQTARIKLQVFDVTGRLVETLSDETLTAGSHHFYWQPHSIASGLYFVRAEAHDRMQTQKLLLIK